MMDSLRNENSPFRGSYTCEGVACTECPFREVCSPRKVIGVIEIVEKWSKEHPIATNLDKYIEVFGAAPENFAGQLLCPINISRQFMPVHGCDDLNCYDCKKKFWNSEYKAPKKEDD